MGENDGIQSLVKKMTSYVYMQQCYYFDHAIYAATYSELDVSEIRNA